MENKAEKQKILHYLFEIGILGKGLDGILEIIGGFLLLFINLKTINYFVFWLTQHELSEDPRDLIANWLIQTAQGLSISTKIFIAAYLLSHGLIKVVLVISLLKNKLWAYPATIIFLLIFIAYQIYQLSFNYSIWLLLLTIFDIFVVLLTWHEFHNIKMKPGET